MAVGPEDLIRFLETTCGCEVVVNRIPSSPVRRIVHVEDAQPGDLSWWRGVLPDDTSFGGDAVVARADQQPTVDSVAPLVAYHADPRGVMRKLILHSTLDLRATCSFPEPPVSVGEDVALHPRADIGSVGQGYDWVDGRWRPFPMLGGVRIGAGVRIGPCTTVMRGSTGDTVIGKGTKIGNGVNIGHDTRIGEDCLIVAGAKLAGWVRVGDRVKIWQGALVKNAVRIGDDAQIGIGAVVLHDVPAGQTWAGNPAWRIR